MRFIRSLNSSHIRSGLEVRINVDIYEGKLHWFYWEAMQFYEAETDSVEQTFDEFERNGAPPFAAEFPETMLATLRAIVNSIGSNLNGRR